MKKLKSFGDLVIWFVRLHCDLSRFQHWWHYACHNNTTLLQDVVLHTGVPLRCWEKLKQVTLLRATESDMRHTDQTPASRTGVILSAKNEKEVKNVPGNKLPKTYASELDIAYILDFLSFERILRRKRMHVEERMEACPEGTKVKCVHIEHKLHRKHRRDREKENQCPTGDHVLS